MSPAAGTLPRFVSCQRDPWAAAAELSRGLAAQTPLAQLDHVLVFCSSRFDPTSLAAALNDAFGPIPVIGCTSAGEIGPDGYVSGALVAVGFPRSDFALVVERIDRVSRYEVGDGAGVLRALLARRDRTLAGWRGQFPDRTAFALLLVDGMSMREELLVSSLHRVLVDTPLIGASAGDDMRFERTRILHEGAFHHDAALVVLVHSTRRCLVFRTEHFVSSDRKMVVTGADPQRRLVTEINAEPAAREYARMVGLENSPLTPMIFAAHPVVVRVGGRYHVRSIQKVNPDESLTFFCAIDEGIVLTVAEGVDIVENFEAKMHELAAELGEIDLVLGFDCILRRLEMEQRHLIRVMSQALCAHRMIGFSAYGEQYHGMHLNQTLTGVAIGGP